MMIDLVVTVSLGGGYLYGRTLTGIEFGRRLIEWVMSQVGGSVVGVWKKVVIMLDEGGEFW